MHKFDGEKERDIVILLVASVKKTASQENIEYGIPDHFFVKYSDDDWLYEWRDEIIEDFPYEKAMNMLLLPKGKTIFQGIWAILYSIG